MINIWVWFSCHKHCPILILIYNFVKSLKEHKGTQVLAWALGTFRGSFYPITWNECVTVINKSIRLLENTTKFNVKPPKYWTPSRTLFWLTSLSDRLIYQQSFYVILIVVKGFSVKLQAYSVVAYLVRCVEKMSNNYIAQLCFDTNNLDG